MLVDRMDLLHVHDSQFNTFRGQRMGYMRTSPISPPTGMVMMTSCDKISTFEKDETKFGLPDCYGRSRAHA